MALARSIKLSDDLTLEIDDKNQVQVKNTKVAEEKSAVVLTDLVITECTRVVTFPDKNRFMVITPKKLHDFTVSSTAPLKINPGNQAPLYYGKFSGTHAHCPEGKFIFGVSLTPSEGEPIQETWLYDLKALRVVQLKTFDENTWIRHCAFVEPERLALITHDKIEYYSVSETIFKRVDSTKHWGNHQEVANMFQLFAHCKLPARKLLSAEYERLKMKLAKSKNAGASEKLNSQIEALTDLAELLQKSNSYGDCIDVLIAGDKSKTLLGGKVANPFPDLADLFKALRKLDVSQQKKLKLA